MYTIKPGPHSIRTMRTHFSYIIIETVYTGVVLSKVLYKKLKYGSIIIYVKIIINC